MSIFCPPVRYYVAQRSSERNKGMKRQTILIAGLLLVWAGAFAAETAPEGSIDAKAAFARLKTLAGAWEADTSMGKVRIEYEVIAGGTALVERESGDKLPAMVTVYHLDGGRLLLTHYCMAGNQPRMQARSFNPENGEIRFVFLDATNLAEGAGHMRNATIRLENDRVLSSWEFYEKGQLKSTESWRYTRVR
jgi:hypothetical protein